ncbi:hypothetical protein B0T26DRAFT_680702 [Lasiosphaeria miniovina]|uniref:Uncharacterized protein n=1 Tax=Lasiosphaeria miniovina TaxID=1954250 RepID=A0AA40A0M7_9PEZI|nr:uncharacterized protein B0T26DRAFT_680702 [Lasiosphaeria miniovina]KAK0707141.1 hypothetical protein B0T26DRAFT_680702 [Lasiosphaeria miniovina]
MASSSNIDRALSSASTTTVSLGDVEAGVSGANIRIRRGKAHPVDESDPGRDENQAVNQEHRALRQQVARHLLVLNALTSLALGDGGDTAACSDKFAEYLTPAERDLNMDRRSIYRHDRRLGSEYVAGLRDWQVHECIVNLGPSDYYPDLLNIRVKLYRAAKEHAALVARCNHVDLPVRPKRFAGCHNYQDYLEAAVHDDQTQRNRLNNVLKRARLLMAAIKSAADAGSLNEPALAALRVKIDALQSYYPDAYSAMHGSPQDLFDAEAERWWDTSGSQPPARPPPPPLEEQIHYAPQNRALVNFAVPSVTVLACIPAFMGWWLSPGPGEPGRYDDAEFWQLVAGGAMQLLGLFTMLWPDVMAGGGGEPRRWTWILAVASALSVVGSMLLYLLVSPGWSSLVSFLGSAAQVFILLQLVNRGRLL